MPVRDEVLVHEAAHRETARARPAGRHVDQRDDLRPVEHHPALRRARRVEPQFRGDDPAQRQLLVAGQHEDGLVQIDRVTEPPVVQPHPAPAPEDLRAGAAGRGREVDDAVRGSVALVARVDADPGLAHVQRPLHAQLRGVERAAPSRRPQPAAAQAQRTAHLRPAQAQLAQRLDHLGLQVLGDREPVTDERPALPVGADVDLADQQVRADLGVREPDPALDPAPRQMQVTLRAQPCRLQPRHRAPHHPQRREVALGQHHFLLETAARQLDVRIDASAREVEPSRDPQPPELQRGHPARPGLWTAQQQPGDDPGLHAALGAPDVRGEGIVAHPVPGAQVVGGSGPEGLPHAPLCRAEALRKFPVMRFGHRRSFRSEP